MESFMFTFNPMCGILRSPPQGKNMRTEIPACGQEGTPLFLETTAVT